MASSSKKRQTFAKMTRERAVREKRELKLEKKRAAAEARRAGIVPGEEATPLDDTLDPAGEAKPDAEETAEPTSLRDAG